MTQQLRQLFTAQAAHFARCRDKITEPEVLIAYLRDQIELLERAAEMEEFE